MQVFSGQGGVLYRVGAPYRFSAPLEDCGDGFDWRPADPALRFWADDPVSVEVFRGLWEPLEPLALYRRSGRVAFGRCLRGSPVRASGVCLPLTVVATCGSWRLEARFGMDERPSLGGEERQVAPVLQGQQVLLGAVEPSVTGPLVAVLPFGQWAFVGRGDSTRNGAGTVLAFDREGVEHVLC